MSFIKIQLLGNVGQDARIQEVNGRYCINFSVAHNKKWTDESNVQHESTTWVSCSYWKQNREQTKVAEFIKSGSTVYVEGIPEVKTYQKDGKTLAAINVNVSSIHLVGSLKQQNNSGSEPENEAPAIQDPGNVKTEGGEDDLPF